MSTAVDTAVKVLAVLLWLAVLVGSRRGGARLRTVAWIGVLAAGMTLRIAALGATLDILTGRLGLSVLISNLLLITGSALLACTQLRVRCRPRLAGAGAGAGAVAVAGWVVGVWAGPASVVPQGFLPMLGRTGVLVSLLGFYLFFVAAAVVLAQASTTTLRDLAPGTLRRDLTAIVALAGAVLAWALTGAVLVVVALVRGGGLNPALFTVLEGGLALLVAAGLAVGAGPLLRGRGEDPALLHQQVRELHRWLFERTPTPTPTGLGTGTGTGTGGGGPADMFVAVVEIRDRMWLVQRWVRPADADRAVRMGRQLGLSSSGARAFAAAVCLEIGVAGMVADDPTENLSADLGALGGAATEEQEVIWLAQVHRARAQGHTVAAAADIFYRDDRTAPHSRATPTDTHA
ncbi:hypothetical protein PSU4_47050 [Pseudonocardia sulfidoxydans NBRC 16205]|uniref:DUF6545 domain-containing protein n=1 Tax=Pseudonocardia sulfidoxydans NBRC 16205 TaxID=1223511 RepID=A0A511DLR2_9PSEU|nr:DUF6545 domain-containing protein [Pseudonocardia sulfidoxydans]GEL25751.1 hypothetical protein PSU4_47050 [Pseudonocardia sulfidoxydans NBRC 16205]